MQFHLWPTWSGECWDVALEGRTDLGRDMICEWIKLVVFNLHNAHDAFLSMVTLYRAQFWLLSMLTSDGTPVSVGDPGQWIVAT
jgi:hypothetical protein